MAPSPFNAALFFNLEVFFPAVISFASKLSFTTHHGAQTEPPHTDRVTTHVVRRAALTVCNDAPKKQISLRLLQTDLAVSAVLSCSWLLLFISLCTRCLPRNLVARIGSDNADIVSLYVFVSCCLYLFKGNLNPM